MRYFVLTVIFICFLNSAFAQFAIWNQETYDIRSDLGFKGARVIYSIPKRFHKISMSDTTADRGIFYTKKSGYVLGFHELIANKDTSIAIGIYISGDYTNSDDHMNRKENARRGLYYVDRSAANFIRYSSNKLADWNTNYGVEYDAEQLNLFMKRFRNARMVTIADINRELHIVYFFKESQRKNIALLIRKTRNMLKPYPLGND